MLTPADALGQRKEEMEAALEKHPEKKEKKHYDPRCGVGACSPGLILGIRISARLLDSILIAIACWVPCPPLP